MGASAVRSAATLALTAAATNPSMAAAQQLLACRCSSLAGYADVRAPQRPSRLLASRPPCLPLTRPALATSQPPARPAAAPAR